MTKQLPSSLHNQLAGGLLGLLIGDALGVPYEFHPPEDIPPTELINYTPPPDFKRAHQGVLPATWSDDGAQALCLLASLQHRNKLDLVDFSNRLRNWYDLGYMAVDHHVYDIGITTGEALLALRNGIEPQLAGPNSQYSNGNGSLMRALPLVLWHQGSDEELVKDAMLQSCVTHRHLRSQLCCALYCLLARNVLQKHSSPWDKAVGTLRHLIQDDPLAVEELEFHIRPDDDTPPTGSGYVVDSLRAAKVSVEMNDSFIHTVRWAIALGSDTDTTACIVGGLIGLKNGADSIPKEWIDELRGKELYAPLMQQLPERYLK